MLRDITIGQYYPGQSLIHRLDPRVKLVGAVVFIASVFLFENIIGFLLITAFLVLCIKLSQVPFKFMVRGLKAILAILLITGLFNLFFTPGEILWQWGVVKITRNGIENTLYMVIRLSYLVVGTSIMTLTTTPTRLTDGMEKCLNWLNVIKVPVHDIAMMMSIALRFIPILVEETDKIMKAQMARGADFENGNLMTKAKNMVPLLVPLFISAWRRATDLAMAMEARCYNGGKGKTKMKPLVYVKRDYLAYIVLYGYLAAVIAWKIIA